MPISFGSDFTINTSDYWVDPTPVAPSYNPVSNFFSQPALSSAYTPSAVPSLQVPTSAGGTGSASFLDSAKAFVSGFTSQLPAITQAAVNVAQAYTSNGSRITPIVLPSGTVIAGEQQKGAYTPGYLQQVPSFMSGRPVGSAAAPLGGGLLTFLQQNPLMLLAVAGFAVGGLLLWKGGH